MAVKVTLELDEDAVVAILMYEQSDKKERPNYSGKEIRDLLKKHFLAVSRARTGYMSKEEIKATEDWAKRVVKGKGFHFKPRQTNWYK